MSHHSRAWAAALAAAFLWITSAVGSAADEGAAPAPAVGGAPTSEAEAKKWKKELESQAKAWIEARKRLVGTCRTCDGTGTYRWRQAGRGGGWRSRTCPHCDGRGARIDPEKYRFLEHDLKSLAFRDTPGIRAFLESLYKSHEQALAGSMPGGPAYPNGHPWAGRSATVETLPKVATAKLMGAELVGERWGTTRIELNKKFEVALAWMRETEQGKARWVLHDAAVDGPFDPSPDELSADAVVATATPLPQEAEALVRGLLGNLLHHVETSSRMEGCLVLVLDAKGIAGDRLASSAAADGCNIARRLYAVKPSPYSSLQLAFRVRHRNEFGATELRPYMQAHLAQSTFEKINWENLSTSEAFQLFVPRGIRHEGWDPWP